MAFSPWLKKLQPVRWSSIFKRVNKQIPAQYRHICKKVQLRAKYRYYPDLVPEWRTFIYSIYLSTALRLLRQLADSATHGKAVAIDIDLINYTS